jgi:integrase
MGKIPKRVKKQDPDHHMRQKGDLWLAQQAVPRFLFAAYRKSVIEESLHTTDVVVARIRRDQFLARNNFVFEALKNSQDISEMGLRLVRDRLNQKPEFALARERIKNGYTEIFFKERMSEPWRSTIASPNAIPEEKELAKANAIKFHPMDYATSNLAVEHATQAALSEGLPADQATIDAITTDLYFAKLSANTLFEKNLRPEINPSANDEPIEKYVDTFFSVKTLREKQKTSTKKSLGDLTAWLVTKHVKPAIAVVTQELAGDFVEYLQSTGKLGPKAVNNRLSPISSYWKYLKKRGKAKFNPFEGQSLDRKKLQEARIAKRPFTEDEMLKLLSGKPHFRALRDCIRILALHGMRCDELTQLRAGDCSQGILRIFGGGNANEIPEWHRGVIGKNTNARRDIPIHPELSDMFERRLLGKKRTEFLIDELAIPKNPNNDRSKRLSNLFGNYRRSIGVHDQIKGQSQSRVDMHSLRRWFIWTAREAYQQALKHGFKDSDPFTEWTIADVAGHDTESRPLGMTMALYPGKSDLNARKACVSAVKLPRNRTNPQS